MDPSDLTALDATSLAERVRTDRLAATELVRATLDRIEEIDPEVNAFRVVLAEQALADAGRVDALPEGERRGLPLAGVPIAVKDDTDVAGESTMWGTAIDRGVCEDDAEVVRRLRRAGAVIIGKTNLPELAVWPWTASETWGVTRNPLSLDRTPGGSSGGSAAAVCTGMAAMALGSDGGGSVRYPAALTGLVGLKPQRDRLPLGPEHGSAWHGLIALGPLTRSVRDAALFLDAAAAPADSTSFSDAIEREGDPLTIAVSTNPPPGTQASLSPDGRRIIDDAAELLGALGHTVVEADIEYGLASLWNSTVRFLKGVHDDVASMPDQERLEARTRTVARLGRAVPRRSRTPLTPIDEAFDRADVVVTPVCESPAPRLSECPSRGALRSLRAANTTAWLVPWNLTGQPALSVPTGIDRGLPTAVQLVGRPGDEATLLTLAHQLEQCRPFPRLRQPPADPSS